MDIKDLNKKQMILVVLLVCFVVSIATGIVTVSLMQQVPKSVPQTINRVIERTINNVTSTPVDDKKDSSIIDGTNVVVQVFALPDPILNTKNDTPLGTGIIISDVGLVLVENSILAANSSSKFEIELDKKMYNAEVLQKFSNGFTILKILPTNTGKPTDDSTKEGTQKDSSIDIKQ